MKNLLGLAVLVSALWASPTLAASDYLLKIDGIDGESTTTDHAKWIEVRSWAWGLTSTVSSGGGSGGSVSKPVFEDFSWIQSVDTSVIPIFLGVATGTHFKTATLDVLEAAGGRRPEVHFQLIFTDAVLTSLHQSGSGVDEVASASLDYRKVQMRYRSQKPNGSFNDWITGTFDLKLNGVEFSGDANVLQGLLQSGGDVTVAALAPVPEPESWVLMLAGTLLTGAFGLRRRVRL